MEVILYVLSLQAKIYFLHQQKRHPVLSGCLRVRSATLKKIPYSVNLFNNLFPYFVFHLSGYTKYM